MTTLHLFLLRPAMLCLVWLSLARLLLARLSLARLLLACVLLAGVTGFAHAQEESSHTGPAGTELLQELTELPQKAADLPKEVTDPALKWKRAIDRDDANILWQLLPEADVYATNDKGKTALMSAAKIGDQRLLEVLVERGLDIEDKSNTGGTALMYAVLGNQLNMINYLLARTDDLDAISTNGWTAAMIAAAKGFDSAIQLLVNAGANSVLPDVYQWSPLMRAIDNRHSAVVNYLLSLPATQDINHVNENGSSALHVAALTGDVDAVKLLLAQGADDGLLDKNQKTARQVALAAGHEDIAKLLEPSDR